LDQSVKNTRLVLFGSTDKSGQTVIPVDWKPPGWEALKNLSLGRFASLGASTALCSAMSPIEDTENESLKIDDCWCQLAMMEEGTIMCESKFHREIREL
jgi:hypothetical protein